MSDPVELSDEFVAALVELGFGEQVEELRRAGTASLPNDDGTFTVAALTDFQEMVAQLHPELGPDPR